MQCTLFSITQIHIYIKQCYLVLRDVVWYFQHLKKQKTLFKIIIRIDVLTLFTEAMDPIPLPGSALTDVAWDAGLWNCNTQRFLEGLIFRSGGGLLFNRDDVCVWVWVWRCSGINGIMGCGIGKERRGSGEHTIGDGGNIVL